MKKNNLANWHAGLRYSVLLTLLIPAAAYGMKDPPEMITLESLQDLYEPVIFDHAMHLEAFSCSGCHHHTTGEAATNPQCSRCHETSEAKAEVSCSACHLISPNLGLQPEAEAVQIYHIDRPGLKGALHLQCLPCHRSEGGPTGCPDCHEISAAGKKRFQVTE